MKKMKLLIIHQRIGFILGALLLLASPVFAQSIPAWRVNSQGRLTVNGIPFKVKGASWTGLEGRQEPHDNPDNPGGAPMELYVGNMFWAETGRTYDQVITEIKTLGFNLIRLPVVPQTLDPNNPQGRDPYLKNAPSVRIENARLALETVIKKLDAAGIYVLLDLHSCSNYVGWRAGRLDARPPYVDHDWDHYDYYRDDCSCSATNNPIGVYIIQAYDETKWLADLQTLAGLGEELDVSNIMGIDIFNDPWDYTWEQWRSMIGKAYEAVNEVNSNILIFAQGISATAETQDGSIDTISQVPHGNEETKPVWGENLYEAGSNPPAMPKNRLVFSPHAFGPSRYVQKMFMDPNQPECAGLEGDAAGDMTCDIVINPALLIQGWDEHFGYLKAMGYAVVIGEFGGNPDWPLKAEIRVQNRYSYLKDTTVDWQWQNAFVNYLISRNITDTIYWSLNPESMGTGGFYKHAYDPVFNTCGWGTWEAPDQRKRDLLGVIWGHQEPTPPPPPPLGDVNGDYIINVVDALMVAMYYIGQEPPNFLADKADVDCDINITIVDALLIAQYYAGVIDQFNCW